MTPFPLRNSHESITLVWEISSVWKGRSSRVILCKGELVSLSKREYLLETIYDSSLEEFSFRRKRKYSYDRGDALILRGNCERNFGGAFSSSFESTFSE